MVLFIVPGQAHASTLMHAASGLGLVGYWPLNEGSGASSRDASGFNHPLSFTSSPSWVAGKLASGLSFSGSNRADTGSISLTAPYTVSLWVKAASTGQANFAGILSSNTSSSVSTFQIQTDGGTPGTYQWSYTGGATIQIGPESTSWHHITVTDDGSGNVSTYYDGAFVATTNESTNGNTVSIVRLGVNRANSIFFSGTIDDVRVYNRVLSNSEISSLYQAGTLAVQGVRGTGLIGWWKFDDGAGTSAYDYSGGGNAGTLSGSPSPSWTTGKLGSALSFGGSPAFVQTPTQSISGSITATAWVYSTVVSQNGFIIGKNPVNSQWELFLEGGILKWRGGANETGVQCTAPAANQWHFVAATQSGTSGTLYMDGVQCGTATDAALGNGSGTIDIGRFSSGYYFFGKLDDVRLYNRALSAHEIAQLYAQNATNATVVNAPASTLTNGTTLANGLVDYWSFDGTDFSGASTILDQAGSNNGTISGSLIKTFGKIGQALSFTGANLMTIGDISPTKSIPFSVSLWFRTSGAPASGSGLFNKYAGGSWNGFNIFFNSGKLCSWYLTQGTSNNNFTAIAQDGGVGSVACPSVSINAWHHVVVTVSSTGMVMYLDGVQTATSGWTGTVGNSSETTSMVLAKYTTYFTGTLDDVRIYSRALSAGEARQLYLLGK